MQFLVCASIHPVYRDVECLELMLKGLKRGTSGSQDPPMAAACRGFPSLLEAAGGEAEI
jgi:hypothetical protein